MRKIKIPEQGIALLLKAITQADQSYPQNLCHFFGDMSLNDKQLLILWTLQKAFEKFPGSALELRIPPFGAVQLLGGKEHKRGEPESFCQIDALNWLVLLFMNDVSIELKITELLATKSLIVSGKLSDKFADIVNYLRVNITCK